MELHPKILEKEGKKEFVILPYEEFLEVQEALEDLEDLRELRNEKNESSDQPSISIDQVKKDLGL